MTFDYSWAGGLYYVLNLSKTLEQLDDSSRPNFIIFYDKKTPPEVLQKITFPDVQFQSLEYPNKISTLINKIFRRLFKRDFYFEKLARKHKIDFFYPLIQYRSDLSKISNKLGYWIYDFQHKYLPEFFSTEEQQKRDNNFSEIASHSETVFVSSQDSANHFNEHYGSSKAKPIVYSFVTIHDEIAPIKEIKSTYSLPDNYFIIPNQFWKHKNHAAVLKAINLLKKSHTDFKVIFTGNENDETNKDYIDDLKRYVKDNEIDNFIIFLGFVPRKDQLAIIKNSIAVIQPSKFEGWSTVVEDAKSLNCPIIVSNLGVHHEQLGDKGLYFDPNEPDQLATHMKALLASNRLETDHKYEGKIKLAAQKFMALVHNFYIGKTN